MPRSFSAPLNSFLGLESEWAVGFKFGSFLVCNEILARARVNFCDTMDRRLVVGLMQ